MELATKQNNTATATKKRGNFFGKKSDPPFFAPAFIQPKLTIGVVDDPYEREADTIADKIMRMNDNEILQTKPSPITIRRKCAACEEEEKLQRKEDESNEENNTVHGKEKGFDAGLNNIENSLQRKCAECEEEEKILRKEISNSVPQVSAALHQTLQSSGQALEKATQSFMEWRFGFDFGKVKIHDDSTANQSSKDINAHAYTHGNHIAFAAGKYQPNTDSGRRLLAHELTHVVQQTTTGAMLQRQSTKNVLRHSGRWTDIDDITVLGMWAKETAINKLWLESTLQKVQEHPERVSELVEAVLPKLRATLYSQQEFSGSAEARRDADEALQARWPLPGFEGIRDQVLEEFLTRYTKQLEQALAHTPE
ncbi:MAG: DUF4157 domain-containing protein, partial [Bacteroidota bacterium]|nr:DUF4157 domain-containing protein [Bacteroidota bacterium]